MISFINLSVRKPTWVLPLVSHFIIVKCPFHWNLLLWALNLPGFKSNLLWSSVGISSMFIECSVCAGLWAAAVSEPGREKQHVTFGRKEVWGHGVSLCRLDDWQWQQVWLAEYLSVWVERSIWVCAGRSQRIILEKPGGELSSLTGSKHVRVSLAHRLMPQELMVCTRPGPSHRQKDCPRPPSPQSMFKNCRGWKDVEGDPGSTTST